MAYTETVNLVPWKGATLRGADASVELFHWYNQITAVGAFISLSVGCLGAGKPAETPFSAWGSPALLVIAEGVSWFNPS